MEHCSSSWFKQHKLTSILTLLVIVTLFSLSLLTNRVSSDVPVTVFRGSNYQTESYANGTNLWMTKPQAVFNGSHWVDYIVDRDDAKKLWRVQTGLISAEIFDSGVATFYDPNMTEQRVKSEQWELWDALNEKQASLGTPSIDVTSTETGVHVNMTRATSKPSGQLTVLFNFNIGDPLKHSIFWRNNEAQSYTVKLRQKWDVGDTISKVNIDGIETSDTGIYNGTVFVFGNATSEFLLMESQLSAIHVLQPSLVDISGKKVMFSFGNWTLATGETLTVDPTTSTFYSSKDSYISSRYPNTNYGTDSNKVSTREGEYYIGGIGWVGYWEYGLFGWDLSSLPQTGIDITTVTFRAYAYSVDVGGTIRTYRVTGVWTETGVKWNNAPSISMDGQVSQSVTSTGWHQWVITGQFEDAYPTTDYSVELRGSFNPPPETSDYVYFRPREYDGYDAQLVIVYKFYPVNDSLKLENPSIGTQGCLSQKGAYMFRVKVTDGDGGSNLNYVKIILDPTGQYEVFQWTQYTDVFSKTSAQYCDISSTSADSTLTGNQWTLNFKITFFWDYPDESIHDIRVHSYDDDGFEDTDVFSSIYYVENDLESYSLNVNDARCNPAQSLTFSGYLRYQGTSSINPNNGNYEVTIRLSGVQKGLIDESLVSGQFSIAVTAESSVDSYSYTVEFSYMTGAGSFSAVVVDRIEIYSQALNDSRVNKEDSIEYRVKARLDYDNHALGSGDSLTANTGSLAWDAGNSWFEDTRAGGTVGDYTFQVNSGTEVTYAITEIYIGVSNPQGIWDKLTLSYSANTTTPDVGKATNITVTATYDYDSNPVSFYYVNTERNSTYFSNQASFTDSSDSELMWQYTSINASDNSFNITSLTANTLNVEWGGLFVEIYEMSSSSRVSVNSMTYVYYHMRWSSNLTDVDTGTLTVNGTAFSINATGWASANSTQSTVGLWEFWVTALNVEGETDFEQVPSNASVIWDKIIIFLSSDSPVKAGEPANISWTLRTAYDSLTISNFAINITRDAQLILSNGANSSLTETFSIDHSAIYMATGLTDSDYGLTEFESNSITVDWEAETVSTTSGDGDRAITEMEVIGEAVSIELSQRGLLYLGGLMSLMVVGGLWQASKKTRLTRKPSGSIKAPKMRVKGSKVTGKKASGYLGKKRRR